MKAASIVITMTEHRAASTDPRLGRRPGHKVQVIAHGAEDNRGDADHSAKPMLTESAN